MRLSAAIVGLGACLMAGVPADAQESSRMLTFGNQDRAAGVTVLRGSAIAPKAAEPARAMGGAERWQVSSGERLWLTDPETGEVLVCRQARTTQVGQRVIRCTEGDLPRRVRD